MHRLPKLEAPERRACGRELTMNIIRKASSTLRFLAIRNLAVSNPVKNDSNDRCLWRCKYLSKVPMREHSYYGYLHKRVGFEVARSTGKGPCQSLELRDEQQARYPRFLYIYPSALGYWLTENFCFDGKLFRSHD